MLVLFTTIVSSSRNTNYDEKLTFTTIFSEANQGTAFAIAYILIAARSDRNRIYLQQNVTI